MAEQPDGGSRVDGDEFRIKSIEADQYTVHPASGATGGVQLGGEFLMDFHSTLYASPDTEVWNVKDGEIGDLISHAGADYDIMRRKVVGLMMTQQNAFGVATWIISDLLGEEVSQDDVEQAIVKSFQEYLEVDES